MGAVFARLVAQGYPVCEPGSAATPDDSGRPGADGSRPPTPNPAAAAPAGCVMPPPCGVDDRLGPRRLPTRRTARPVPADCAGSVRNATAAVPPPPPLRPPLVVLIGGVVGRFCAAARAARVAVCRSASSRRAAQRCWCALKRSASTGRPHASHVTSSRSSCCCWAAPT